jgi:class 3 adenylate cyclase/tetratricopeptide (TPR) repeat protein
VPTCPSCGRDNPEGFAFCGFCSAPLEQPAPARAEERKVVSVLFVDLVGFTAASEAADPEDVRARLVPYQAMLKREIERFGGTVEKFIGDAVMAVFGAPVAHEDDAERAVRAALRITEAIDELNREQPALQLEVRAGINTGETLVNLAARPELGEGIVTGDAVNTASRLQGVAPVGGVAVGEATYRATRDAIEFAELPPASLKGKSQPVRVRRAVAARSRFGVDVEQRSPVPMVGRDRELGLLQQVFERALHEPSVQLVTVSGEPGVGKSRLVWEFQRWVDDRPELVSWRQGRCLPYGEGITFWALGEVVKAQAGILESDGPDEAEAKLAAAVESAGVEPGERDWVRAHLAPLVGASGQDQAGRSERDEAFAAWRTFVEALASGHPLVMIVEDTHWADEAMLAFVEHLVDWTTGVPLVVLCTARPELFERHPGWGGGKRNSTTVALGPLAEDDTARLVASLLDQAVLPATAQQALLDRCGGNPLYAEEFVRMLIDRGVLHRRGGVWTVDEAATLTVPESVQALIAARLDTLDPGRKSLLQDAAVLGKVFWSGAVASMGDRDQTAVRDDLHELARREFVRPARRSSVGGQAEYSFWHLLIRDVAYQQIPRGARADKHRAAAGWIEEVAGDRVADHAELLAFHHEEAIRLREALGEAPTEDELRAAAQFLDLAGEKTDHLDLPRAIDFYERAAARFDPASTSRAEVLMKLGRAYSNAGRADDAIGAFREAIEIADRVGDAAIGAEARGWWADVVHWKGEAALAEGLLQEAAALLEGAPPGRALVRVRAMQAARLMILDRNEECVPAADAVIDLARPLGMRSDEMIGLQCRGIARVKSGDSGGLEDLEESLRIGLELGIGAPTAVGYTNYADCVWFGAGPQAGLDIHLTGMAFGTKRGLAFQVTWTRAESLWMLYELGRWDEVLSLSAELLDEDEERGGSQIGTITRPFRALVQLQRGHVEEAARLTDAVVPKARDASDPQVLSPALVVAAQVAVAQGERGRAVELLDEMERATREHPFWTLLYLADAARAASAAGDLGPVERLIAAMPAGPRRHDLGMLTARAVTAEHAGRHEEAAGLYAEASAAWADYGHVVERALADLGAGRCLAAAGDRQAALRPLRAAQATFTELGAGPLLSEASSLLVRAAAQTS